MSELFGESTESDRFNSFYNSLSKLMVARKPWVAYYRMPSQQQTARIEIQKDLLQDWTVTRYTHQHITRRSFSTFDDTSRQAFKWILSLERKGMYKSVENNESAQQTMSQETGGHEWVQSLMADFTEHNDWVDLATCLTMSADEYIDANWRRFKDWLWRTRQRQHTDVEIYAFGLAVWQAYRRDVIV